MSSSTGSAASSSGGGQLGARPKTSRPKLQEPAKNRPANDDKWDSNWNSVLSAQEENKCHNGRNGQPPSTAAAASFHQQRQWPISRGASDPSLAQQQPVRLNNINSNNNRQKPLELFHSPHYHARRDRAAAASRSSSAADLSRSSSTTLSSNTSLNIKDSTSGGISSIWSRWFRRNNNRNQQQRQQQQQQPRAAAVVGVGSRSHSVENSPVVSRRRENNIMTGSSGGLAAISDSSDSLSTHSFAFIRAASTHNSELTLRRKYGLMDSESVCSIEGDAIRAMRTQWESQIKELENPFNSGQQRRSQASTGRKKRPAPPPPQMFQGLAHVSNQPSTRSSVASTVGFTHVPGKRKAPSPPIKKVNSQQSAAGTSALNIPPATTTTTPAAAEVSSSQQKSTSTEQKQKHPTAAKKQMLMEATAVVPQPDDKWTNDLNSNMDDKMAKTQLFRQKKVGDDCPHNDILKLEGGLLRPLDRHNSCKPAASDTTTPASTMDSMHRMTLPLKPWYKRGHPQNHPSIQHNTSNRHHQQTRSRWKDAALLNPLLPDDCWIGLPSPPATTANRQFSFNAPTSTGSTLTVSTSNTVSPPGSTKSGGSSNSSDGSKKRKSLLVNISQLDREAAEIIQRERARESHRKRLADERFYSGSPLEPVPDDEGVVANEIATKCTRELIDMFNSLSSTKMSSSVDLAINSQQLIAKTDSNANNKTTATAETQSSSSSVSVTTPTTDATTMEVSSSAAAVTVTPICSSSSSSESTITRLRVNQKTVPTTTTTASSGEQTITSIFNPKLEVVTSQQQQRRPSIEYTGGARPKTNNNNNISVTELTESVDQQLVNGTPPKDLPPSTPVLTPGWACHVCTLINSDARLWCEACTALKPRLLLNRPSVAVAAPSVTTKPTIKSKPESLKMSPDDSMMKKNAPLLASNETTKNRTTAPSGDGPSTPADCKVSEDNKENRPSSPEALRQARLAFFLSGNNQQQQKPSEPVVVEQPAAAAAGGDKNNNNTKRHSQQNHVKVSSSSQTTAPIPSLIKIRPLSMLDTTDSVISNTNNDNNKNSSTSVSAETNNKIRIAVKDVTPTNFAVLSSPSRTQLSQYLQQRDQQQATTNNNNKAPNETDEQLNKDSTVVNEEKRVDVLLWRLEEAIAAGQFDKAAVLAKELAAIKKPSSVKPPDSPILLPAGNSTIVLKPVAAPRSIIPASIKPVASTPPLESPLKSSDVKDSANPAAVVPINNEVNLLPLPPKRSPPVVVEPIPVPRTVRPQETAMADVEEKKPEIPNVTRKSVERESPGRNKIPDDKKTDPVPILPEVAVVKPKRTKVSSGQQTTLTYQRKPDDKRAVKERAQSCIIDDTFKVEVFIEDRSTHSGPFSWAIKPTTTLLEVKQKMEQEHHIPVLSQRWILGRRLADKDEMTLQQYDICPSNSSLFLYVLTEPIKRQTPPPKPNRSPPPPPLPTTKPPELNAKRYYNFEEDRYSTCEESDEGEAVDLRNDDKSTNNHQVNQVSTIANPQPLADESPVANHPPQSNQDQATPTVDYKKLLDLDQSDVVANAEAFDCSVCMMNVPTGVGITLRECLHNFCRDCLAHVIEFSDEAAVTCPFRDDHYACDSVIQEREIKALVPPNIYERHLERSMRLAEKAMKNTFHCQTADCPGWAIIEDNVNVFRCPVCTKTNCLTCQAIHEGANCKQYQDRVNLNAETDEDAKRTKEMIEALVASGEALSCPQCQVVLMKRWGCDWVRCSVCRTEICWVTKQSRWGPKGKGDTSGGCRCGVGGVKCHPLCNYCH